MSLVEDARSLAQNIKDVNSGACNHCTAHGGDHRDWCPTLDMPRIVAALEAAERVVRIHDENSRVVWDSPVFHEIDVLGDTLRGEEYTT